MPHSHFDISIIIVSWNVSQLLHACLHSIYERADQDGLIDGLNAEIIVVDSASADDSVAMVARDYPQVNLLAMQENVGFPKGNNLGMAQASGRYIFLLNPDTVVVGDALARMVAYLDTHADVGLIGSLLRFPDQAVQSSRRRFPSLWTAVFESTWLEPWAPKGLLDHYYVADVQDDQTADVDWVMGASMMVRADIVRDVGGMDADYFMYSEELDWCRRIKTAGWRIVYFPKACIIHYQGKSSEQASTARHINFNRAKLRYFRKYHGRFASGILRIVLLANYASQILIEGAKGFVGHRRELRWQRVAAYWQVLRSGLRPAGY